MPEPGSRRGRVHDAEGAREAILDAAEAVFAEHGFDGARIDAIAAAAGYNKSLIFQYYGDKLRLYDAVIRRADHRTRGIQERAVGLLGEDGSFNPANFERAFRSLMGEFWDFLVANPRFLRIMMWEMAESWSTYSRIVNEQDRADVEAWAPLLYKLQDAGVLRGGMNPVVQFILTEFFCMTYLASAPMFQLFLGGEDVSSPPAMAATREHVFDLILHGMMAAPGEERGPEPPMS